MRFSSRSSRSLWSVLAKWNLKKTSLFFNETLESLGDKIGQMTSGGFFTSPQHAITARRTKSECDNYKCYACTVHYSMEVALTISNILRLYTAFKSQSNLVFLQRKSLKYQGSAFIIKLHLILMAILPRKLFEKEKKMWQLKRVRVILEEVAWNETNSLTTGQLVTNPFSINRKVGKVAEWSYLKWQKNCRICIF